MSEMTSFLFGLYFCLLMSGSLGAVYCFLKTIARQKRQEITSCLKASHPVPSVTIRRTLFVQSNTNQAQRDEHVLIGL